jgi:hypothetical protein
LSVVSNFHKIVKSFKKLGLGTPPLKKRKRKQILFLCYRVWSVSAFLDVHFEDSHVQPWRTKHLWFLHNVKGTLCISAHMLQFIWLYICKLWRTRFVFGNIFCFCVFLYTFCEFQPYYDGKCIVCNLFVKLG